MRLLLSSVLLGLAWFGAINIAASLGAWLMARVTLAQGVRSAPVLLAIRFLPAVSSLLFVLAIFLPAHWRFEDRDTTESFGMLLAALAVVAAAILLRSARRAIYTAWRGHRLLAAARAAATPLDGGAIAVPGVPGVSLAGILRPQILVGCGARDVLTAAELDVAISHEVAHQRSRDNLKRFLMFCAPDVFGSLPIARRLEKIWEAEAECRADADAVASDDERAIVLASALVKVARLRSRDAGVLPTPAWSAFDVPTLLEMRICRLVAGGALEDAPPRRAWAPVALAGLASPIVVWLSDLSYTLHLVTEALVTHLP